MTPVRPIAQTTVAPPAAQPAAVRALTWLLAATAVTTVVVEVLNWVYAPEGGFALAVRTGWALLRSIGFLILIWHVRRGRAGARPFGLILAVTTVFAVGRLIVPRDGAAALPGVIGFAVLVALCATIVALLYRSPALGAHLVRHPPRLTVDRKGIYLREAPARAQISGWLLTARVAAFAYTPLMLVPALVALGGVFGGEITALPAVVFWLGAAVVTSYVLMFISIFLVRGSGWARSLLVGVTFGVLLLDLALCWWLLGVDGLIRDGGPMLVTAAVALYAVRRYGTRRADRPVG